MAVGGSQRPGRKTHPGSQRVWREGKQQIIPRQEKGRACLPHSALGSPNKTSSERLVSRTRPWPVALRCHEGQHGNCWQHLLGKDPLRRVKIKVLFFINEDERSQTAVEIGWSTLSVHREGQQVAKATQPASSLHALFTILPPPHGVLHLTCLHLSGLLPQWRTQQP